MSAILVFTRSMLFAAILLVTPVLAAFLSQPHLQLEHHGDDNDNDNDTHLLALNGTNGWGTFDQLIDHSNPAMGTFKQRFWYGTQYWAGPGSPIFLINPGERAADGFNRSYTTERRLPGLMAKTMRGAVVILEHRYWGNSVPFTTLTTANMRFLTLENSIKDNTYFAQNFKAPFDSNGTAPNTTPWILLGGSYPGALAGWTATLDGGTFWAYYGTSGVVQAVSDFWQYYRPVMEATPPNCTVDQIAVIAYVDDILLNGTFQEKLELKNKFLLGDLEDADFASALQHGPWTWQKTQFYNMDQSGFTPYYRFCDYVENVWPNSTNPSPGPTGVGLVKALAGYAKWFVEVQLPNTCKDLGYSDWNSTLDVGCYMALNRSNPVYHDFSSHNPLNRQWMWMLCNEPFNFWQDSAPLSGPSFVSRLVNVEYWQKQCKLFFPETYSNSKTVKQANMYTGGWSGIRNTTRLMFTNGQLDPWRDATVSSIDRPGGPLASTAELPVRVVQGGTHCSDLYAENWEVNEGLKKVVDEQVATMKTWVGDFYREWRELKDWML